MFSMTMEKEEEAGIGFSKMEMFYGEDEKPVVDNLTNDAFYVGRKLSTNRKVPGNIHREEYQDFWMNKIKPSQMIKDVIEHKYRLPFSSEPPRSFEGNNKSAREDLDFVRNELQRAENLGCIKKVNEQPHLVLPLSSVFSKKKRLVVDASRALNPFLRDRRVRLQDHRDVPEFVKPGDVFIIEDLDSGYWHLGVHEDDWKFLGVSIEDEQGQPQFWVWTVLFLGVKDAVFIFTALLKPVRSYIVSQGIPCLIYLDDCCGSGRDKEQAKQNRKKIVEFLSNCGFIVSFDKSKGPDSRILFLGLEMCSRSMKFFIPEKKLIMITDELQQLLSQRRVKVRAVARILGLLQSCGRALGNIVRLRTRYLYMWLNQKLENGSFNHFFSISEEGINEIQFWIQNLRELNGFPFSPELTQVDTKIEVVTDTSSRGMFGYQLSTKYEVILRKIFTAEEAKASSTVRELLALKNIYTSDLALRFSGLNVVHYTDNMAVQTIMEIGSKKPHLLEIVLEIFHACKAMNIRLSVVWKPRDHPLLQHADLGSKSFDETAYSLDFSSFMVIMEYFNDVSIDVDAMANLWNRKQFLQQNR